MISSRLTFLARRNVVQDGVESSGAKRGMIVDGKAVVPRFLGLKNDVATYAIDLTVLPFRDQSSG
jgi:hypothetical protein